MNDYDHIFIEIGVAPCRNLDECALAGLAFLKAANENPNAEISLMIGGYDQDPRELWEIPEVIGYLRWFARYTGLHDWRAKVVSQLHDETIGILAQSGIFAPDHPFLVVPKH